MGDVEKDWSPTRFESFIVKYPCPCCWCWCGFAIFFMLLTGMLFASETLGFDGRGVWDIRSHEVQNQYDAFIIARQSIKVPDSQLQKYTTQSKELVPIHFVYFSENGDDNFLSAGSLEWMRKTEAKLLSSTKFPTKCMLQNGIDSTQSPTTFITLNANDNVVTVNIAPANGTKVMFSGNASVLEDRGMYRINRISANSFKLMYENSDLEEFEVQFSTSNDITAGRFLTGTTACGAAQSLLSWAYPAVAEQTQYMCDGFVGSSTNEDGISVLSTVCGCDSNSLVFGTPGQCTVDCRSNFAKTIQCSSTAYVFPDTDSVDFANMAQLCPNYHSNPVQQILYEKARADILPKEWGGCSSTNSLNSANMARSIHWIGGPLPGYQYISGDSNDDQVDDLRDWAMDGFRSEIKEIESDANSDADGTARVVIEGQWMINLAFDEIMMNDSFLALGSIWFVFMWTWASTGSVLLATGGIFETCMSLPMAMATWGIIGQEWLGLLTIMMLFVILGIGADDVFVLVDAWKQSGQQGFGEDVQKRFSWAYRRARDAMTVTTVTTFFGFFAAGLSEVPSVSGFGYFAAFVVFWDYILCVTFFASLIVVYHNYFEQKNICCSGRCASHMLCCPCTCLGMDDPKPMWKKPKITLPFVTLVLLGTAALFVRPFFGCLLISSAMIFVYAIISVQTDANEGRKVEKFFQESYYPVAFNHRLKFFLFILTLFIGGTVAVAFLLRLPDKEEAFLTEHHPTQRYVDSGIKFGSSGAVPLTWVNVVFGIDKGKALDRTGVDYQQPGVGWDQIVPDDPLGKVQWSAVAQQAMVSTAGQNEIIALCDSIRTSDNIAVYDSDCEWVVHDGVGYPRFVPRKNALLESRQLTELFVESSATYYQSVSGSTNQTLSNVSSGYCASGVYCFMYEIRDYVVSFCNPSLGLKHQFINKRVISAQKEVRPEEQYRTEQEVRTRLAPLCLNAQNQSISGGIGAWPYADLDALVSSAGWTLYENEVMKFEHNIHGMSFDEYQRRQLTDMIVENGKLKLGFIGFNSTIPVGDFTYSQQKDLFDMYEGFFYSRLTVNNNAFFSAFIFNWMLITEALITNTIQAVCLGIGFALIIATLMTWNILVALIVVSSVVVVVVISVGIICLMGWKLSLIEALVLIVIVGISVDYSLHIAHAYNHAPEDKDKSNAEIRESKAFVAVGSMGISLLSGVATSMGSALFLWFCKVAFFRKFGMFLLITLVVSFHVTFMFLIPLFMLAGPVKGVGEFPALPDKCKQLFGSKALA